MYNKNKDKRHLRNQSKAITRTGSSRFVKGHYGVVSGRYEELEAEDNKVEAGRDETRVRNLWNETG